MISEVMIDPNYKSFWSPESEELLKRRITVNWVAETRRHFPLVMYNLKVVHDTALEVGCGIGRLMKPMSERFDRVIGLDFSSRMLESSKHYLKDFPNTETRLIEEDYRFPVEDHSVDFVYSMIVLQHIPELEIIQQYLRESFRVLKPGGALRVQTHRGQPSSGFNDYHGHFFSSLKAFELEVTNCDFKVISKQEGLGHPAWLWVTAQK